MRPNYRKIFEDMILKRFPERRDELSQYLVTDNLTDINVIDLNQKLFGKSKDDTFNFNQKHRSYDKDTIFQILDYQRKENLNNIQVAKYFGLSRNTISKWKKLFF